MNYTRSLFGKSNATGWGVKLRSLLLALFFIWQALGAEPCYQAPGDCQIEITENTVTRTDWTKVDFFVIKC